MILENNDDSLKMINIFSSAANMSLDDYFGKYDYYNILRLLAFKKAYDHAIETGIKKGEIRDLTNGKYTLDSKIIHEYSDYWIKVKKEMKNKTSFKVNDQYLNRNFILNKNKLYTFGGEE